MRLLSKGALERREDTRPEEISLAWYLTDNLDSRTCECLSSVLAWSSVGGILLRGRPDDGSIKTSLGAAVSEGAPVAGAGTSSAALDPAHPMPNRARGGSIRCKH